MSAIGGTGDTALGQRIESLKPSREQQYRELAEHASSVGRQYEVIKKIARTVAPTVAHIEAKKRQSAGATKTGSSDRRPVMIEEAGSGIVIQYRKRFYVVTNYHVVESSVLEDIRVESDGILYNPTRLLHDRETDLSVLELSQSGLTPSMIGDSDQMEIGDFVVAIGSPFGLSHSVSYGIISSLNRNDLELGPQGVKYQNFMQTDAAINPGNSGGPLINLRGEVIGINTAIASNSGGSDGIGFTIPINMVMRVVGDLIDLGQVRRGFLGVSLDSRYSYKRAMELGLELSYGAYVTAITPGSPADAANLQIGDVIVEFDNHRVNNDSHLVTSVSLTDIGDKVPMRVFRRGQFVTVFVTIQDRRTFGDRG